MTSKAKSPAKPSVPVTPDTGGSFVRDAKTGKIKPAAAPPEPKPAVHETAEKGDAK